LQAQQAAHDIVLELNAQDAAFREKRVETLTSFAEP